MFYVKQLVPGTVWNILKFNINTKNLTQINNETVTKLKNFFHANTWVRQWKSIQGK